MSAALALRIDVIVVVVVVVATATACHRADTVNTVDICSASTGRFYAINKGFQSMDVSQVYPQHCC